jgi:hypothetical protein
MREKEKTVELFSGFLTENLFFTKNERRLVILHEKISVSYGKFSYGRYCLSGGGTDIMDN